MKDCTLAPELATALASAVRLYYSGNWRDDVTLPPPRAIDYGEDQEPGGTGLTDYLIKQDMQRALERLKLYHPHQHRLLLRGLGNKLDPSRAKPYYLALCVLWAQLLIVLGHRIEEETEK